MSYNYDLEVMLEENRLKSALSSLIQWFKDKIKLIKEKITTLINKLRGKDIPPEKKGLVSKIKGCANDITNHCKQGISACKQGAADKAKSCKDKVMDKLSNMSNLTKALAVGSTVAVGAVISHNPTVRGTMNGRSDGKKYKKGTMTYFNLKATPKFAKNGNEKVRKRYNDAYDKGFAKTSGIDEEE